MTPSFHMDGPTSVNYGWSYFHMDSPTDKNPPDSGRRINPADCGRRTTSVNYGWSYF